MFWSAARIAAFPFSFRRCPTAEENKMPKRRSSPHSKPIPPLPSHDRVQRRRRQAVMVLERPGLLIMVVSHLGADDQPATRSKHQRQRRRHVQPLEARSLPLAVVEELQPP